MMSDPRDCDKCDRKIEKGELFYHSRPDSDVDFDDRNSDDEEDFCMDCYNKKLRKGKISEEDFQLMVYCLPAGTHNVLLTIVINMQNIGALII